MAFPSVPDGRDASTNILRDLEWNILENLPVALLNLAVIWLAFTWTYSGSPLFGRCRRTGMRSFIFTSHQSLKIRVFPGPVTLECMGRHQNKHAQRHCRYISPLRLSDAR